MDTQVAAAQARQALAQLRMEWREGQSEVKDHLEQLQEAVAKPPEVRGSDDNPSTCHGASIYVDDLCASGTLKADQAYSSGLCHCGWQWRHAAEC
jgi:hypothetical protein